MGKTRWLAACVGLLWFGCGSAPPGRSTHVPVEDLEQYFVGTAVVRLPDGTEAREQPTLMHRTLRPEDSLVIEDAYAPLRGEALEHSIVQLAVTGDRLVLTVPSVLDTHGAGTVSGEAWRWNRWHTEMLLGDGTQLVTDELEDATGLQVDTRVVDRSGTTGRVVRQMLRRVSREEYERRAAETAPAH